MLSETPQLPDWRSIHFIPANVQRYVDKAASLEADAFQIDLEDSIPQASKQTARERVRAVAAQLRTNRPVSDVLVRINRPLREAVRDIEAAVGPDVAAITVTKTEGPSHVRLLDEVISDCEAQAGLPRGHTRIVVVIETPAAFACMRETAEASARVVAMMLGTEDFALGCGCEPTEEVMRMPKQQMIIAARAAGVLPLGYLASIAGFRDPEGFAAMVRRSRDFGYAGGTSIHPAQIPVLNQVYGPTPQELDAARRVIEADAQALAAGRGSFEIDGRMVDAPIVERARRLLARAERTAHPSGQTSPRSPLDL